MAHLLKRTEVENIFGVSKYLIYQAIEEGKLQEHVIGKRWKYFKFSDCLELFAPNDKTLIQESEYMSISSTYFLSKFAAIISKNFEEWPQAKAGIIDSNGNIINREKFKSGFKDPIYRVARKVKMLLQNRFKVPDNKVLWTAISLYLLKEDTIGQVLNADQSQEALAELQELKADFHFEEKIVLQKIINLSGKVVQKSINESFKDFIGEPEEDKPRYRNTFQILSGYKFWKRLEEEEARASHGK